ncbi:MAG: hypothetical protein RSH25_10680 [Bacteroides sp.]|uniref:hypothetical protein n=1 Tax=Bacteroides sp. TaxID=29523 RepID=UPI002FC889EB
MIKDQIREIIDKMYNGKVEPFARDIGISRKTIDNYYNPERKGKVSSEVIESIASSIEGINCEWLITGKGEMLTNDSLESEKEKEFRERIDDMSNEIGYYKHLLKINGIATEPFSKTADTA